MRKEQLRVQRGCCAGSGDKDARAVRQQGVNSSRSHAFYVISLAMPSILSSSAPPLPIAQCLDAALGLFRASLLTCLPYGVLTVLVSQLPQLYGHLQAPAAGWWATYLISGVLGAMFFNATLLRLAAVAGDIPAQPDARRELRVALKRVPAFIGLLLLLAAASAVLEAPALLVPSGARAWVAGVGFLGVNYLGAMLSCAWVELVLEGRGVLESVAKSIELVRGNALRVVAACAVGALMLFVLAVVAGVIIALIVPLVGGDDLALITAIAEDVMVACAALAVPFVAALLLTLRRQLEALHGATLAGGAAACAPE
jgi:hypothetical protein